MKKLSALLVLTIFLISLIPIVSAEGSEDATGTGDVSEDAAGEEVDYNDVNDYITEEVKEEIPIERCIKKAIDKYPHAKRAKVIRLCKNLLLSLDNGEVKAVKAENKTGKIRGIKNLKGEDFRERQKEQLMIAVDKCKEKELGKELCEKKFTKRIELIEKLKENDLERLKKIEERKTERAEEVDELEDAADFKKYDKKLEFKARAVDKTKLEGARANFLRAKENFLDNKEKYREAQQKFQETKEKLAECSDAESDECSQLREDIIAQAKENALRIADSILEHLNKIKSKVEANEELTEEEAAELISAVDGEIAAIEEAKAAIESAESKEDVIGAAKALKEAWAKIRERAKEHVGITVNARIGGIIVKSKHLELKLERTLAKMAEKGLDTSAIEPLVDDFNAKLDEAKTNYETAVDKFKEAKASEEPNEELIQEAQGYMNDAHRALQDAQKILKDIVSAIKQNGGEDALEETEEEAEIEEEVEEETEAEDELEEDEEEIAEDEEAEDEDELEDEDDEEETEDTEEGEAEE